jgi:hypothetical protein
MFHLENRFMECPLRLRRAVHNICVDSEDVLKLAEACRMAGVEPVTPYWSNEGIPHAVAHVGLPSIKLAILIRKPGSGDTIENVARHRAGWERAGWKMADIRCTTLMKTSMRELVAQLRQAIKAGRKKR